MRLPATLLLLTLFPAPGLLAAEAHQHGVAQLDMVTEPPLVAISFSSPLANLTGFEHRPSSPGEQNAWNQTLARLQRPAELIGFPAAADCSLSRVDLHLPFTAQDSIQSHEHAHNDMSHELHSDLMAEYHYLCANSAALNALELPLMQRFPGIERLDVQLITPGGQYRRTLTAGQTGLQLP